MEIGIPRLLKSKSSQTREISPLLKDYYIYTKPQTDVVGEEQSMLWWTESLISGMIGKM